MTNRLVKQLGSGGGDKEMAQNCTPSETTAEIAVAESPATVSKSQQQDALGDRAPDRGLAHVLVLHE